MSSASPKHSHFDVDVAILLRREGSTQPCAAIDRELVDLLLAIQKTASISEACLRLNCSPRHAHRLLKRFKDGSGIKLLKNHGRNGSALTEEAKRCIFLHAAARDYVRNLVDEYDLIQTKPLLFEFAISEWQQTPQMSNQTNTEA